MINDKQKIKIHKLIQDIEKKKKLISDEAIGTYVELKKSEGKTSLTFSDVKSRAYEKIDSKEISKKVDAVNILTKQQVLLDDILSSESNMRLMQYAMGGVAILLIIWFFSWIFSPSEKKDKNERKTTSSRTYTKRSIDIVSNSAWDSSVYQVEDYLKNTLKDPDSYQSIEWWKVKKTPLGFKVLHKYRAKNSFGGYIVETAEFVLDSKGNVLSMKKSK